MSESELERMQGKQARAYFNGDFFSVRTLSGHRMMGIDPLGAEHYLPPGATDEALGIAVIDALKYSRLLSLEDTRIFFDPKARDIRYTQWVQSLTAKFGYKGKQKLFKNMMSCGIRAVEGVLTIAPTLHERLEGWGRKKDDGIEDVVIQYTSEPIVIGQALRLAFSRCR